MLAAAARLGYPGPNPLAAGLRRGRVGALGFAYDNPLSYAFDDPVVVAVLAGISAVAEQAGSGLLLVPGSAPAERNSAAVASAVIDGLVVFSLADDDPLLDAILGRHLPLVVIDQPGPPSLRGPFADGSTPWIGVDDRAAAAGAAAHLLALGHRRLGVVSFGLARHRVRGMADETAQQAATYAVTRRRWRLPRCGRPRRDGLVDGSSSCGSHQRRQRRRRHGRRTPGPDSATHWSSLHVRPAR